MPSFTIGEPFVLWNYPSLIKLKLTLKSWLN